MREHYPSKLQQQWTSYQGTGRNIFGMAILHGHGRPGPIILLNDDILAVYIEKIDDSQKKALYELFASENEPAIDAKVTEIYAQAFNAK